MRSLTANMLCDYLTLTVSNQHKYKVEYNLTLSTQWFDRKSVYQRSPGEMATQAGKGHEGMKLHQTVLHTIQNRIIPSWSVVTSRYAMTYTSTSCSSNNHVASISSRRRHASAVKYLLLLYTRCAGLYNGVFFLQNYYRNLVFGQVQMEKSNWFCDLRGP